MPPLLEYLRQATRPLHRTLDHHPLLSPLTGAGLDATAYARALASLHAVFACHEALVCRYLERGTSRMTYVPLQRLAALESDLHLLEAKPYAATPALSDLPPLASPAQLVGVLYVLEGSALGGQLLERMIGSQLPGAPRRFFTGLGLKAASQWANFRNFAESTCPKNASDAASTAARDCFGRFLKHLDACSDALRS